MLGVVGVRLAAVLTVAALLLLGWPPAAPAAYPGTNGPLLVAGSQGLGLIPQAGGKFIPLAPRGGGWDARFSAAGDRVAYSVDQGNVGVLRVRSAGGGDLEVMRLAGVEIVEIAWSPDSRYLAFLGSSTATNAMALYRVPSSGGNPVLVRSFGNGPDAHSVSFDWHPTANLLAVSYGQDVWTMDPSGGSVAQWTDECIYPKPLGEIPEEGVLCDADGDQITRSYTRDRIRWTSSGSAVVLAMVRSCNADECARGVDGWFLATLTVGAKIGVPVTAWPPNADSPPDSPSHSDLSPTPSPDGSRYAYRDGRGTVVTIAAGGQRSSTGLSAKVFDWQPCPGGRCPSFVTGKPTTITVVSQLGGTCTPRGCVTNSLITSGTVRPPLPGQPVVVTLQALRNGKWSAVGSRQVTLSRVSAYRASFQVPGNAAACRVTATFAGNGTYLPSSAVKTYRC